MITDEGFAERWATRGDDRWRIVRQVHADWRTPLGAGDGIDMERVLTAEGRLGVRLPAALREWYVMAGARDDLRSGGNHLLSPERLRFEEDDGGARMLIFYQENQCAYWWGLRAEELGRSEDPPVYVAEAGDGEWVTEDPTLSQFVLQMTLLETQFVAPFTASGPIPPTLVEQLGAHFEDLGLTWWHWPAYPGRRFARRELLLNVDGCNTTGDAWAWLAAKTRAARDAAMRTLDELAWQTRRRDVRASVRTGIEWVDVGNED